MSAPFLFIPLLVTLAGAVVAAAAGLPALNRRLTVTRLAWLLALAPLVAFGLVLWFVATLGSGPALVWRFDWIPSLGLSAGFYLDHLSALFALLVTGIGVLVVIYAGYYFKGEARPWGEWRFLTYLLLFMTAMLGLVLAGDVITLFIFWEGTSVTSFLLIAYKTKDEAARRGAFKSLFITGGGGIALLVGLLLLSYVAGSSDLVAILDSGELVRDSALYPAMLGLVALGAFTKSAQSPFHIWLPGAMSAPTPASAYLHSATMVKAGVYLLARLNPALGFTDLWFWLLSLAGLITMLVGAYLGLKQNDLKSLLAYSTVSQLGVLVVLIGQDTEIAFKALVIGVLAHALYKSALFLIVGIVDHEAGSRDLRRLGGLARAMPFSFAIGGVAALSMAGLPPLFGFLAKETLLATATHPNVPPLVNVLFPAATVLAGAFVLAQAAMLLWDTFLGKPRDPTIHSHEGPWAMLLAPALPAFLSLAVGLLPEPQFLASFLAAAAAEVYGAPVKVSLALWTGITVPLVLSVIAVSLGTGLFVLRHRVRVLQMRIDERWSFDTLYAALLHLIDRGAGLATRIQSGKLRMYLIVILVGMVALVVGFGGLSRWDSLAALSLPRLNFEGEIAVLRIFALLVTVAAAAATVVLRRDFSAVVALGASGLAIAVLMVLEPAPDVALVQVVVDILTVVVLVLALTRLPREQRQRADTLADQQSRPGVVGTALIATVSGLVMAFVTLVARTSRPRESVVTPFYEGAAKALTGAKDIVGAIIVDFRALDTLIEIAVFSLAGLGVYTLLRYASKRMGDGAETPSPVGLPLLTKGIGGRETSPFVHALAYVSLPLSMVIAVVHIMYGHDQPGDGFTAGVIVSLALGFWYVVFGYYEVRRRLTWLRPAPLIAGGLLLAIVSAVLAALIRGSFLAHVDFGQRLGLPLPLGFNLSTSFLFEVAICLAVLGSASYLLDTLGHPGEEVK
ncbi:MAG: proton-conducting transporter membrane subunit [Anaerolineae bacterium]|jgi:NADH:ubiquinone oxidoreductase subunit 5 (subunit L)/multisubunit Na+/H+ antiporter MnhA subunit/multisubunit Na+/H+ antiporter MnhB subunit